MKELIKKRLARLRAEMDRQKLQATLIFGTDPHLSEYLPAHWQTRSFISGFTGSAGMVIIATEKAALWTDSRYFLQAENELEGTGIELVKMRTAGHLEPVAWLKANLSKGNVVGTDEWCISANQFSGFKNELAEAGILLKESGDLLSDIWDDRPPLPDAPIYEHELQFACTPRKEKIAAVIGKMKEKNADFHIISALDDLAWTFNLRGSDIECNPLFLGYAIISADKQILFIQPNKISGELEKILKSDGITIAGYDEFPAYIAQLPAGVRVLIDRDRTTHAVVGNISESCTIVHGLSVPCQLKACKTDAEIANIRNAMKKDGVAMTEFLYWLKNSGGNEHITEFSVAQKLIEMREKQAHFRGISFYPIVGYKEHGAIVHFHVNEANALPVRKDGFLLFDSGGQYLDGTTDITRTVALSEPTDQQKTDFTLVLKGMIALSIAKFPKGTRGYHLDILARNPLWQNGLNYGHGTGHGVGYFLNVHEGPMSIRQDFNEQTIEPGMVLSNEPALYRQGAYGIRTENVIVCRPSTSNEFGEFLEFETLTLCPIDTKAIEKELLTTAEIQWLNSYHERVYAELVPMIDDKLRLFFKEITRPI